MLFFELTLQRLLSLLQLLTLDFDICNLFNDILLGSLHLQQLLCLAVQHLAHALDLLHRGVLRCFCLLLFLRLVH